MNKVEIAKRRKGAVSLNLDLEKGDRIGQLISRESGLFAVTLKTIFRVKSPTDLDPQQEHPDAPWEQSLYLPHGSIDPFVARTVLQTQELADIFVSRQSDKHRAMMDIAWEILNSLVSLRVIKNRLEKRINEVCAIVQADLDAFTKGQSPRALPIVEYFDIEFRSFVNEVRRLLSTISDLFAVLTPEKFSGGHFHRALQWAQKVRGEQSLLAQMLKGDQRWIKLWIDMRIAIEHPEKDRYVETLNFALEPSRAIRLPTWRFVHPDYDMARPQNLLVAFENCINNVLKFYEDLQVTLVDGHLPRTFKVGIEAIDESDRDPEAPMRYRFHPFMGAPNAA